MTFVDQLTRIRRFLRDPDGKIWDRNFIEYVFNDIQEDIQQKTDYLEGIEVLNVPAFYQMSYMFEFEYRYLAGTKFYRCLYEQQQNGEVYTNHWEFTAEQGIDSQPRDEGTHFTQPWEAFSGITTGDKVPIRLPDDFGSTKLITYDQEPISYFTEKHLSNTDPSYLSHEGRPYGYYIKDEIDNEICLFPRPSSVLWNDVNLNDPDPSFYFTYTFEGEDNYFTGVGSRFVRNDTDNLREYLFDWEDDLGSNSDTGMRGMYLFEAGAMSRDQVAHVFFIADDNVNSSVGIPQSRTATYNSQENGIPKKIVEDIDNVLLIYNRNPVNVEQDIDESSFPEFLQKYIEYGVMAECYASNTDGRIRSLAEYWQLRYDNGIRLVKRFMENRNSDRHYRLKTAGNIISRSSKRHPRLPSTYPVI